MIRITFRLRRKFPRKTTFKEAAKLWFLHRRMFEMSRYSMIRRRCSQLTKKGRLMCSPHLPRIRLCSKPPRFQIGDRAVWRANGAATQPIVQTILLSLSTEDDRLVTPAQIQSEKIGATSSSRSGSKWLSSSLTSNIAPRTKAQTTSQSISLTLFSRVHWWAFRARAKKHYISASTEIETKLNKQTQQ